MKTKTVGFIEQEEYYQYLRDLINQFAPDQREQFLDIFKGLCRFTKKQINIFIERYRQEDVAVGTININSDDVNTETAIIYSILEKLAEENELKIKRGKTKGRSSNGKKFIAHYDHPQWTITLIPSLSGEDLNWVLAHQLGIAMLYVDGDSREDRYLKQSCNLANMLINGIRMGLLER